MASGFIEFLTKTNALALAVAVVIGAAIGKVVSAVVADLLMPIIGLFLGGGDWRAWQIPLKTAADGKVLSALGVGNVLGSVVDFVIIAFFVFVTTKALIKEKAAPARSGDETVRGVRRERAREGYALQVLHKRGVAKEGATGRADDGLLVFAPFEVWPVCMMVRMDVMKPV